MFSFLVIQLVQMRTIFPSGSWHQDYCISSSRQSCCWCTKARFSTLSQSHLATFQSPTQDILRLDVWLKIFLVRMLYWIIYPIGSMPRCISFSQLMPWLFLPLCNPNMNPMICKLGRSSRLVKMIASVLYNAHSSFPLLMALAEKIRIHIKTESTILVNRDSTQKGHVLIAKWNSDKATCGDC